MDPEEEDALNFLKNSIMELLKDISYIGGTIQKKSTKILSKISNTSHTDIESLETLGLGVIKILKIVKENMIAITNTFEKNVEKLNKDREEKMLTKLNSMLLEYKNLTAEAPKNTYDSKGLCDKAMQTDLIIDNNSDVSLRPKTESIGNESIEETEDENEPQESIVSCSIKVSTAQDKLRKGGLSLKKKIDRTDTQDTDDCWTDSLVRSPTVMDFWNREYQGEKINATDEYLDQLKKELENDDEWEREAVALNRNVEKDRVDSSDDSFVDGRTTEEEKEDIKELVKDAEIGKNETFKSESDNMSSKYEPSISIEEHKLPDLDVATAPNNINAENDSAAAEKSSIIDKLNLQPEKNINEESSKNLNTNKELNSVKSNIDSDPIPGCSKDQNVDFVDKIHCDSDKNLEPANEVGNSETVDSNAIETDNYESATSSQVEINWSQSTDELLSDSEVFKRLDMPENSYISPYSVETVKLGSDSDELPHSQCSEHSDSILTQDISNKNTDNDKVPSNSADEGIGSKDVNVKNVEPNDLRPPNASILEDKGITPDPIQSTSGSGLENINDNNLQECNLGEHKEINKTDNCSMSINNDNVDNETPKADISKDDDNSSQTSNEYAYEPKSIISDTTHSDKEQDIPDGNNLCPTSDKIDTDSDKINKDPKESVISEDRCGFTVSDKPQSNGSDLDIDTTSKTQLDINEQVEQPETCIHLEKPTILDEAELELDSQIIVPNNNMWETDSVEKVLYEREALSQDKTDTEDECQLTQVINFDENNLHGTNNDLLCVRQEASSTNTDISKNKNNSDSGLPCDSLGDEEQVIEQIKDITDLPHTGDSNPPELVSDITTTTGVIMESTDKSDVTNKQTETGDPKVLDKINKISNGNEIESNLENSRSTEVQPHASSQELLNVISDTTKSKELELSIDESCDPKLSTSVVDERLQEIAKPDIDNINSMEKEGIDEDVCSSKSFEFDISGCLTRGDENVLNDNDTQKESTVRETVVPGFNNINEEKACEENDDEKVAEDIVEALEELLSRENKDDNLHEDVITKSETIIQSEDRNEKDLGAIKETIEIASDSDDDGVHLEVTMEEIISSGSFGSDQEDTEKTEEIGEIVPVYPDFIKEEIVIESGSKKDDDLADELLELLREVEMPSQIDAAKSDNKSALKSDEAEAKEADEIFKMLEEEIDTDISDIESSNGGTDLSSSDLEWIDDNNSNKKVGEDKKNNEIQSQQLSKNRETMECYVALERLEINEDEVVKVTKKINDSIDRLCDISNLLKKRKFTHALGLQKASRKRVKLSKQGTSLLESDTESFSDFTDSETEKDKSNIDLTSPKLPAPLEQKLDDILANEICNVFKGNTSDESSDYDSDDSHKIRKKKKNKDKGQDGKHSDSDIKEKLSKEELLKKSWKNDPLLRGKLNSSESDSSTSSTSSSEKSRRRRNALKSKYEHDTDFYIVSDSSDTDSDGSTLRKQNKVLMEEKLISPIKKNIPISDSDSTDSEIEFVPQQKTPEKNIVGEEEGPSNSQKGRRNIRALMSAESLAEATQRANKDEQERIERLEDRYRIKECFSQSFSQNEEEEDLESLVLDVDANSGEPVIKVHPGLNKILKPHQRDGIQFMWDSCYESVDRLKNHEGSGSGCILAHCMGLGKTFQVLALIHTLFTHEITNTKHVLVVCPLSTVNNWKKEVKILFKDLPKEKFNVLTIADKKETSKKYEIVKKWYLKRKCVLVLGYEGFETLTNECKLDKGGQNLRNRMLEALVDPGPDLVICDEGHLLRNKKALKTLALNRIRTKRRIVLTGTPLQNNLMEYYHMVQFVKPNLLGNMKEFKTNFENPITNGQYEDSTKDDIKLMMKRTHVLHKLLKKSIQRVEDTELKIYLPKIVDYAIFIQLHPVQVEMYNKFSELVEKNSADTNKRGFLSDFRVFQYIGTHPYLLSIIDDMKNKKIKERDLITNEQEINPMCNIDNWWKAKLPEDASEKIDYGNKLKAVKSILEECEEIGDKVLLFSQSLGEMDLIEHFLKKVGTTKCPSWKKKVDYFRMDGTVSPEYRTIICDLFNDNENKNIRLLLMSTKVGGLGLNLTAANRVIIMTVNWNPSFDTQSVFRVYRFGQEKAVFVYRLISLDTMEEKVYQRTVTKLAIAHRVVDKHQITRHYKSMDLQELYSCRPKAEGERTMPNLPEDLILGKLILKLPFIFKYHEHQALLANRPEDNLNEQELNAAWDEFKKIKDAANIPPPQLLMVPQQIANTINSINTPTFNVAFALTRPASINSATTGTDIEENWIQQYYIPKPNTTPAQQKNGLPNNSAGTNNFQAGSNKTSNSTNLNAVFRKPNHRSDTVIAVDSLHNPGMIPLLSTTSSATSTEQDPLFIPESTKPVKTYNDMLKQLSDNQQSSKLSRSTSSKILEKNLSKSSQKENSSNKKTKSLNVKTNKLSTSIVIEDDEVENNLNAPKLNLAENNVSANGNRGKRKPVETNNHEKSDHKKMKYQLESQNSINLDDDDDDVTEITDSVSDSGSLSSDIVKTLGLTSLSGITIHKVTKESTRNNNVITLD